MIEQRATAHARALGAELTAFQTNFEGELIERIHRARDEGVVGIVVSCLFLFMSLFVFCSPFPQFSFVFVIVLALWGIRYIFNLDYLKY